MHMPPTLANGKIGCVELPAVETQGGSIVQSSGADHPEITARFRDPGGNIIGLHREPRTTAR